MFFSERAPCYHAQASWLIRLQDKRKKLEHEPSMYNVGWSHGKEKLGDTPDFAKGSFYGNPLFDEPGTPVSVASGAGPSLEWDGYCMTGN